MRVGCAHGHTVRAAAWSHDGGGGVVVCACAHARGNVNMRAGVHARVRGCVRLRMCMPGVWWGQASRCSTLHATTQTDVNNDMHM